MLPGATPFSAAARWMASRSLGSIEPSAQATIASGISVTARIVSGPSPSSSR